MALDNAEFIAELSIADPPGTDPLNQGDDHIRTTKKAVQQSFPNVGSAVPQTGAQMAQMAIKNELNTFTQVQTFAARIDLNANLRFQNDADRGIQWADSTGTQFAWEMLALQSGSDDFHLGRYVGGVFQDTPFRIINSDGSVVFLSIVVQVNDFAFRIRNFSATNDSGINFIGDSATLNWQLNHKSAAAGRNFQVQRYNNAGAFQDIPIDISFSNGETTFAKDILLESSGASFRSIFYKDGGLNRWSLGHRGSNDDWEISRYSAAGTFVGTPITVVNASGHIIMVLPVTEPVGAPGTLYTQTTSQIDATERVLCVSR